MEIGREFGSTKGITILHYKKIVWNGIKRPLAHIFSCSLMKATCITTENMFDINGRSLSVIKLVAGVLQGCVVDPLLFTRYINDLLINL